ncbi:HD domain-containing protein [Pseudorhodoferax soli]|uniref:HD domain-containing protein n=2 Tax=Pseudorhodoferax soli TaxID=545864 RepID=A0A368XRB1_9BURK|nr:HD domain-containing protein [Pseudorhodoferax soli]RCW69568.1 HD domain-containing protein [Pseudorhodoferax soli]
MMPSAIPEFYIPDSQLAREMTQYIRDTESDLLFHHSVRVYCWGYLTGARTGLSFDPELLYAASMFHDIGLTARYRDSQLRFEVDGANAAREFLRSHGVRDADIETVWNAVALHTTPGIPQFMRPEIALVQAGAGMDVAGRGYDQFSEAQRAAVVAASPREADFAQGIIDAFYEGMQHRPLSTFGTFNDDVLAFKDPAFQRVDMCSIILASDWTRRTICHAADGCPHHDHPHPPANG